MRWQDIGIILKVNKFRDRDILAIIFTKDHGKYSGLIRWGASRRYMSWLQPGTKVQVKWQARLEDHLGVFTLEPCATCLATLSKKRLTLTALVAARDLLLTLLPERERQEKVFQATCLLLVSMQQKDTLVWLSHYARWELFLLKQSGYAVCLARTGDNVAPATSRQDARPETDLAASSNFTFDPTEGYNTRLPVDSFVRRKGVYASCTTEVKKVLDFVTYYLEKHVAIKLQSRSELSKALSWKS